MQRKRILFRAWHRESHECDLVIGSFSAQYVRAFNCTQLSDFEALLDCSDSDLIDWVYFGQTPPAQYDHEVLQLLRSFCAQCFGGSPTAGRAAMAATG